MSPFAPLAYWGMCFPLPLVLGFTAGVIWNVGSISDSPVYRTPVGRPFVCGSVFPLDDAIIAYIVTIVYWYNSQYLDCRFVYF